MDVLPEHVLQQQQEEEGPGASLLSVLFAGRPSAPCASGLPDPPVLTTELGRKEGHRWEDYR